MQFIIQTNKEQFHLLKRIISEDETVSVVMIYHDKNVVAVPFLKQETLDKIKSIEDVIIYKNKELESFLNDSK